MSTDFDFASDLEDRIRTENIKAAQNYKSPIGSQSNGFCLNTGCDNLVEAGARWCCAGCRDDWQRRNPGL